MAIQLGLERWHPIGHAFPGEEGAPPVGDPFADVLPFLDGPTGPDRPDVDDEAEEYLGYSGDESVWINHATGNLVVRLGTPKMEGIATPVILTYNLQDTQDRRTAGQGWMLSFDDRLDASATTVTLTKSSGNQRVYPVSGGIVTQLAPGTFNSLTQADSVTWIETQRNGKQRTYVNGYLDHVADRDGNRWTCVRDAAHTLTAVLDPGNRRYTLTRGTNNYIASILDPAGRLTTLLYDASTPPRLQTFQQSDGSTYTLSYDAGAHLQSIQDPDGFRVTFTLGTVAGNPAVLSVQDGVGATKQLSYDTGSRRCVVTDPLGLAWTASLDSSNRLSVYTDPQGRVTSYLWNAQSLLEGIQAPLSRNATYLYNSQGRLTYAADPLAHLTTYGYSADGNRPILRTDPTGAIVSTAYDPVTNDRTAFVDEDGNRTSYVYNAAGQVTQIGRLIDGLLSSLTYSYFDATGQSSGNYDSGLVYDNLLAYDSGGGTGVPFTVQQDGEPLDGAPGYAYTQYFRDAAGNPTTIVDADLQTLSYLYSPLSRPLAVVDSLGRRTSFNYDGRGNPVSTVDPMGNRTTSVFDGRSRLVASVDALGNRTTFGYDLAGQHTLTTDAVGAVTSLLYSRGRDLIKSTDPLGGVSQYIRDAAGRLAQFLDPTLRLVSLGYDLADRVVAQAEYPTPTGPQVTGLSYTARDEPLLTTEPQGWTLAHSYTGRPGFLQTSTGIGSTGPAVAALTYVSTGGVKSATDPRGNVVTNQFSAAARVSYTQDALGRRTTYLYTAAGDMQATINARGAVVTLLYDLLHRPTAQVVSPRAGVEYRFTTVYDDAGRVSQEIFADGTSMSYGYFPNGWLQFQVDPMGFRTSFTYTARGQVATVIDPEGRVTTYGYDLQGRHTLTIDPAGFRTTMGYDLADNLVYTVDPLGSRVTYVYDGAHRLSEIHTSPSAGLEYVTQHFYDGAGRVTLTVNPDYTTLGYNWQFPYGDGYLEERDELLQVWTSTWDKAGNAISRIDPNGNRGYVNSYDALNRLSYTQGQRHYALGPSQALFSYVYDEVSNRTAVIDALGRRSTTQYDLMNRATTFVRSTGSALLTESQDFDGRDNRIYRQDARGSRVTFFYDFNRRLTAMQDPLGAYTSYSYDKSGRRTAVQSPTTPAGIAITTFGYDPRGLVTTLTYPDAASEVSQYDAAGRRIVQILPSGKRITFTYDNMGRMTALTPPSPEAVVNQWFDARSRRVVLQDGSGGTGFTYDAAGRLAAVQAPHGALAYSYDFAGRRTQMSYAAGSVLYGYDPDNNLVALTSAFGEVNTYGWDLANQVNTLQLANGSVVSHRYDNAGRLVYRGDPDASSGIGFLYGLDANGNRTTIAENSGVVTTSAFDLDNRLVREQRTGDASAYLVQYAYDLNGSVTARDLPGGGRVTFTLDNCGRVTADTAGDSFSWNADARLASRTGPLGTLSFDYDHAGRVTSLTIGGSAPRTLQYVYDGDGGLQGVTRAGQAYRLLLDGRNVIREQFASVQLASSAYAVALRPRDLVRLPASAATITQGIRDYTYGLGLLSERVSTLSSAPATYSTSFFRWDGRATARRQEGPAGADLLDAVYDGYGLLRTPTTLASAYGFVGEEGVRQEWGLPPGLAVPYHMRARMYDPLLCRFTSRDPVWDVNPYEYAKGNPWSNIDPDGRQAVLPGAVDPHGVWSRVLVEHGYERFDPQDKMALRQIIGMVNAEGGHVYDYRSEWVRRFWANLFLSESRSAPSRQTQQEAYSQYQAFVARHPLSSQAKGAQQFLEIVSSAPIPVVQQIAAGGAVLIAVYRHDWQGAALDALALIPFERLAGLGVRGLARIVDEVAARAVTRSDLAITKELWRMGRVTRADIERLLQNRHIVGQLGDRWLKLRGLQVLYRGQGVETSRILGGVAQTHGVRASKELESELRSLLRGEHAMTDAEIGANVRDPDMRDFLQRREHLSEASIDKIIYEWTGMYHGQAVRYLRGTPLEGKLVADMGIPFTTIPGVAAGIQDAGPAGVAVVYAVRVPRGSSITSSSGGMSAEFEHLIMHEVTRGTSVRRIRAGSIPRLSLDIEGGTDLVAVELDLSSSRFIRYAPHVPPRQ